MEEKRCYGCMKIKKSYQSVCEFCGYDERRPNEIHQLAIGTVLKEQYLIGRVLGQGGFGITYLGWDLYLDIPVAIKEYFPSGTVMRETSVSMDVVSFSGEIGARFRNNKERFMREAKMLAKFSQVPEIVQVRNFFLANNTAYIVMEYVDGITLKQYVKNHGGKLSLKETLVLMEPVIVALGNVHKSGLVHRDISPDNIMMLPGGKVKLLDFGAVRDVGDADVNNPLTKSTEAILKQGYAPIEQYQNRGSLGPWTDVYALCATIYYCLTGEVPPDAPERLLGEEEIPFREMVPELSEQQEEGLRKGMALRAQERIASLEVLYEQLYKKKTDADIVLNITNDGVQTNYEKGQQHTEITHMDNTGQQNRTDEKEGKSSRLVSLVLIIGFVLVVLGAIFVQNQNAQNDVPEENQGENISQEGNNSQEDEPIIIGTCGENLKWTFHKDTQTLLINGQGEMDDYNGLWFEEGDGNYDVEKSYAPWADYMGDIRCIKIGDDVIRIGYNAFACAENLMEVQFGVWGSNLREIAPFAFWGSGIEHIILPDSLESLGEYAFQHCHQLKTVDLPYRLDDLKVGTFEHCEALESIVIRPYMEEIAQGTNGNNKIEGTPFGCLREDTWVFPENLTIHTYKNCVAEEFALERGIAVEYIHDGKCGDDITWHFDEETKTLYLDGSGDTWFYDLHGQMEEWQNDENMIQSWLMPDKPDWRFSFEDDIESVILSGDIHWLNDNLLSCLPNLNYVDLNVAIGFGNMVLANNPNLEEIEIPSTVDSMGSFTFYNCSNLRKVSFGPREIYAGMGVAMGYGTFANAVNLEEIHCSEALIVHSDIFNPDGNDEVSEKVVFYVYELSEMHKYAKQNGFTYIVIEEPIDEGIEEE